MRETSIQFKAPRALAWRIRAAGAMAIAATMVAIGCAKPPTEILTEISAEPTVPALLILQYTIVSAADPTRTFGSAVVSQAPGDAADGRSPFFFPMIMRMGPLAGWSGAVAITLNGRDWETDKIIATGTTTAEAVPEKGTPAKLTLTAVSDPGGADGGTGQDAADDPISDDANSDS